MGLETGTHIDDLVVANPASTDGLAQADDHIRLIKTTLKNTFPSITAAVSSTHTELNALDGYTGNVADLNYAKALNATGVTAVEFDYLDGVSSALQPQLAAKAPLANPTFTGTLNAPTVDLGDWTIAQSGSDLVFSHSGTARFKLSSAGALIVEGDVTAFGAA